MRTCCPLFSYTRARRERDRDSKTDNTLLSALCPATTMRQQPSRLYAETWQGQLRDHISTESLVMHRG